MTLTYHCAAERQGDTQQKVSRWAALILDHGLRSESLAEAETAVQQADDLGLEAFLLKVIQPVQW